MKQFLFSPTKQFQYASGKLLAGGKIYVYFKDTENLAPLFNADESYHSNPIILDANGRASVKADDTYEYRLEVYSMEDILQFTCNAFYAGDGSGSGGTFIVRHDESLSGNGTSQYPLGVINIPLAVDDTMTAYEEVIEGTSALVLGVESNWFNTTFGGALSAKADTSALEDCYNDLSGQIGTKLDSTAYDLSNYYNKQETNNILTGYTTTSDFNTSITNIQNTKQDTLTFGYNSSNEISSINNSGIAGNSEIFPVTGTDGVTNYIMNLNCSGLSANAGGQGHGYSLNLNTNSVTYRSDSNVYSASWRDITKTPNISAISLITGTTAYSFNNNELNGLMQVNIIMPYVYDEVSNNYKVTLENQEFIGLQSGCYYNYMKTNIEGTNRWVMCGSGYYSI